MPVALQKGETPQKGDSPHLIADSMPVETLGVWLFLAGEAMFFVAMLGSFVVLESAGGQHQIFSRSSRMLSPEIGILSAILLVISTAGMLRNGISLKWIAIACAVLFLLLQILQWRALFGHHTTVFRDSGKLQVGDGDEVSAVMLAMAQQMNLPKSFDIHSFTPGDFPGHMQREVYMDEGAIQDLNYGPSRNNFFACYFLLSAVHCLHVIAAIVVLLCFILFVKGKIPDSVQIYWHFVNAVGLISFFVLYFV
jgi:heme/copper-type cytochrome/quinol oxidase subunit 3